MKSTKKALLLSMMSMLLCVAMLMGTTFAWFTDSVTSGVNKIVAGNLDVEVEYMNDNTNGWKPLQDSVSVFSKGLWEPGHTEFVTLKIENKGTLALNYKALITPVSENGGINVAGEAFRLSDYLVFKTVAHGETVPQEYTRDTARADAGSVRGLTVNDLTKTGSLEAGKTAYVTLIVYMPEEVGNAANYKTGTPAPTIELGIKVFATQKTSEADSFNDQYDADAIENPVYVAGAYYDYFEAINASSTSDSENKFEVKKNVGENILASATGETENAGDTVTLTVVKSADAETNFTATVAEDHELNGYDIKVTGQKEGTLVQAKLYVGTGLQDFKFYHNGTAMTLGTKGSLTDGQYCYDSTEGYVYFASTTFSPFQSTYKAPEASIGAIPYGTLQDAFTAAKNGETVTLLKDVKLTEAVKISSTKAYVFDGNGFTITIGADGGKGAFGDETVSTEGLKGNAQLTVKNANFASAAEGQNYAVITGSDFHGTVTMDHCSFYDLYTAVLMNSNGETAAALNITNCAYYNTNWGYSIDTVSGKANVVPTFTNNTGLDASKEVEIFPGYVALVTREGKYVNQYATLQAAIDAAADGDTVKLMTNVVAAMPNNNGYANHPVFTISKDITLDGNNKTISVDANNWQLYNNKISGNIFCIGVQDTEADRDVTVTVKDLTIAGNKNLMKHGITAYSCRSNKTELTLDNVTIKDCGANGVSINRADVKVDDVTISNCGWDPYDNTNGSLTFMLDSADDLFDFASYVNAGNPYVNGVLTADIDLENEEWTPIGSANTEAGQPGDIFFAGAFDGQNHTIKNLKVTGAHGQRNLGLFGIICTENGADAIQNLTIDGAEIIGDASAVGVLAGSAGAHWHTSTEYYVSGQGNSGIAGIKNVTVKNATVKGAKYVGALVGYCPDNLYDITIDNCTVEAVYVDGFNTYNNNYDNPAGDNDSAENAGGATGDGGMTSFINENIKVTNTTVTGKTKVGAIGGSSRIYKIVNCDAENCEVNASSSSNVSELFGRYTATVYEGNDATNVTVNIP